MFRRSPNEVHSGQLTCSTRATLWFEAGAGCGLRGRREGWVPSPFSVRQSEVRSLLDAFPKPFSVILAYSVVPPIQVANDVMPLFCLPGEIHKRQPDALGASSSKGKKFPYSTA